MRILSFDTSTHALTVSLGDARACLWSSTAIKPRQHDDLILSTIQEGCDALGWSRSEFSLVVCGIGPGSFMGVRLAVSVAQAVAIVSACDVIGVSSLRILAQTAVLQGAQGRLAPAWDARLKQMYVGDYRVDDMGIVQPIGHDRVLLPKEWACVEPVTCVGNAWQVYADDVTWSAGISLPCDNMTVYPDARALWALAVSLNESGESTAPDQLAPQYVREQVAQVQSAV